MHFVHDGKRDGSADDALKTFDLSKLCISRKNYRSVQPISGVAVMVELPIENRLKYSVKRPA